jgi:CRP/FNR family transcriptional regulator, cyclic AMP receptor protein
LIGDRSAQDECDRTIAEVIGSVSMASAIFERSKQRRFSKGEVLFHGGDRGDSLHFVGTGRVALRTGRFDGALTIVRIAKPGQIKGDHLLSNSLDTHPFTAVALDAVWTRAISKHDIDHLIRSHPRCMFQISSRALSDWLQPALRLGDSHWERAEQRVLKAILHFAAIYRDGASARIPVTHEIIASYAGVNRSTATMVILDAKNDGHISVRRGAMSIPDIDKFTAWVRS